jgi:hypothetical protein
VGVRRSWIWDSKLGKLVPLEEYQRPERKAPYIQPDLPAYIPVGGPEAEKFFKEPSKARMIEGRKAHREYLKRNGFVEVGNEKAAFLRHGGKTPDNAKRMAPRSPEAQRFIERLRRDG